MIENVFLHLQDSVIEALVVAVEVSAAVVVVEAVVDSAAVVVVAEEEDSAVAAIVVGEAVVSVAVEAAVDSVVAIVEDAVVLAEAEEEAASVGEEVVVIEAEVADVVVAASEVSVRFCIEVTFLICFRFHRSRRWSRWWNARWSQNHRRTSSTVGGNLHLPWQRGRSGHQESRPGRLGVRREACQCGRGEWCQD